MLKRGRGKRDSSQEKNNNFSRKAGVLLIASLLAACGLPDSMAVRSGVQPKHQDDDVRFRTTYFYRVFDYCASPTLSRSDPDYIRSIKHDSLYRFKMTGKAYSLFSKVFFESGTLKNYEIDPLGARIGFDEKNGRFHYEPREETDRGVNCASVDEKIESLSIKMDKMRKDERQAEPLYGAYSSQLEALVKSNACLPKIVRDNIAAQTLNPTDHIVKAGQRLSNLSKETGLIYEIADEKKTSLALTLPAIHSSISTAANKLKGMTRGLPSNQVLKEAGEALKKAGEGQTGGGTETNWLTLKDNKGEDTKDKFAIDDKANTNVNQHFVKLMREISNAGQSLIEVSNQPQLAALYMSFAGARLQSSAQNFLEVEKLMKKKGLVKEAKEGSKAVVISAKADNKTSLSEIATVLNDAGQYLRQADFLSAKSSGTCLAGEKLQRGFQLMGPQGAMLFDQDDRLIMAMSTSSSPLIQQLKEISGQMLAEQQSPGDALLAVTKARLKVSETRLKLNNRKEADLETKEDLEKDLKALQKELIK